MNSTKFANYLLSLLIVLMVVNYIAVLHMWNTYQTNGLIIAVVILLVINTLAIYGMTKIKVYDDKGASQNISDVFANVIGIGVVLVLASIVVVIGGSILGYKETKVARIGIVIPILAVGVMYSSLAFTAKVLVK